MHMHSRRAPLFKGPDFHPKDYLRQDIIQYCVCVQEEKEEDELWTLPYATPTRRTIESTGNTTGAATEGRVGSGRLFAQALPLLLVCHPHLCLPERSAVFHAVPPNEEGDTVDNHEQHEMEHLSVIAKSKKQTNRAGKTTAIIQREKTTRA